MPEPSTPTEKAHGAVQRAMIEQARALCQADERLSAAMIYGSFAQGSGDAHSDIEFILFFSGSCLEEVDRRAWVEAIGPLELFFDDDVGHQTAIFSNLVRGEFHFYPESRMEMVDEWVGTIWFPSVEAAVLLDRAGELTRRLEKVVARPPEWESAQSLAGLIPNFLNWMLFGWNVLQRGELARAYEVLHMAHRYLIKLARLQDGIPGAWLTPARLLEHDLSADNYERFRWCTAQLEYEPVRRAYGYAWRWGARMIRELCARYAVEPPASLIEKLDRRLANA